MKPLITLTCSAFKEGETIPEKYTCIGQNLNPPLNIENIPKNTKGLSLIFEDPDAPNGVFTHWLVWNIPVSTKSISENAKPRTEGLNSNGKIGYMGPCPPSGKPHRYIFRIYALDIELKLEAGSDRDALERAMQSHIIAEGNLRGIFSR
ncbi:YbhB/YbcL family Raf kinase inhibitor-like protein [Candidatus Bathycorpusculum sp.]|jgi:Raf kinase inhibitor-like YbhB/YbcL family protein|uniref:YbhB/YbcL family Raf kinase inhibitor-like protein n=1 Tax=Candidatus Bathycorpusculum sp. TaxID=2994959 RepID=UPI002819F442|nr:YbhB/YbcL family Raf kinase inhibitor-like protein [Candidatus Termitimicrobium sp.]MCL2685010.1 YbhB/YbcL family Raf kinase inhibitor-like protein [Candidatus Termitimicrobium sp.]